MSYLEETLKQFQTKSLQAINLPESKFDSDVDFNGDGVVIEGHIISASGNEFSFAGEDEDVWIIKANDVIESSQLPKAIENVPGAPIKLKVKSGATIRLERNMEVGKHIIGSSSMEQEEDEMEIKSGPPSGCKCARRCTRGWCCAQGGWVYKCQRSSCVFTRVRC